MKAVIYSNKPLAEMATIAVNTFGRVANHNASVPAITEPVVTEAQQGIIIHYVPAQPRKQLKIEFRIPNNSDRFRSKTDTLISYVIGNRSPNTLADWLQKQGLADGVSTEADPVTERTSGVFSISVSLTDKGLAQRDEVVAAVFSYLAMLRKTVSTNAISMKFRMCWRWTSVIRQSPATWTILSGWRIRCCVFRLSTRWMRLIWPIATIPRLSMLVWKA